MSPFFIQSNKNQSHKGKYIHVRMNVYNSDVSIPKFLLVLEVDGWMEQIPVLEFNGLPIPIVDYLFVIKML